MIYKELVEKIKAGEHIRANDISAAQMFRLYKDRHLKYIQSHGNEYELNLIPLNNESHIYEAVKPDDSFKVFIELVDTFIENKKKDKPSFLICDHEEYEVVMELMTTNE